MEEPVEILTREPRRMDGAERTLRLPYLARYVGTAVVDRPRGYLLPAHLTPFLEGHGLRVEPAPAQASVEVPTLVSSSQVGKVHQNLEASAVGLRNVSWSRQSRPVPAGSILLPTEQPLGALAVYLCEPESDDGLLENGLLPTPAAGQELPVLRVLD
jgi:hypothetical protein